MNENEKPIEKPIVALRVMEALQEEAYKGIVRVDTETMHQLGVRPGDVVEIEGNRVTVGIVDRAYPTDVGQAIIRMDGILRRNSKTGLGENVKVSKAIIKEAKSLVLAPAQSGVMVHADPYLFKKGLLGRATVKGDIVALGSPRRRTFSGDSFDLLEVIEQGFLGNFGFAGLRFIINDTNPKGAVVITEETEIKLAARAEESSEEKIPEVTYEDIGGLNEEIKKIRELVELPLKHPALFERLGVQPPKGVLLHGQPGTGKTLLAKAVANESDANFLSINSTEIMSKFVGEAEKRIRDIFAEAEKNAPTIIFIDEIDAIAPKREEAYGEVERRVVAQLLATMDGLKSRGKVIVIGATNRPNALDSALRRPGRFDREIEIGIPGKEGRLAILNVHARNMPLTRDVKLNKIASITHGFVGADLEALCKEAAMNVIRRVLPDLNLKENTSIPNEVLEKLTVTSNDFKQALKLVRPSAMREVLVETPSTKWEDIGGLEETKQELKEAIEWPFKNPQAFKNLGIRPPRGILLSGPPGTGKTLLAKAVANESEANFILVKGPELLNKWVGESEKGVRRVFERARQTSPTIVFFDEIDAIAPRRGFINDSSGVTDRVLNQILTEIDGLEELHDVIIIGATNRPDIIDPALLRPGRFDRIISLKLPNKKSREAIFHVHTKNMPLAKDVALKLLVEKTNGFVGADIESLCREAAMIALREDIKAKDVKMKHFETALNKARPSVTQEEIKKYEELEGEMRSSRILSKHQQSYIG